MTRWVAVSGAVVHDALMETPTTSLRPWATKRPQSLVLSAVMVIIAIAVMVTAVSFVSEGRGGIVPVLMLVGAPVIAGAYLIYFNKTNWD